MRHRHQYNIGWILFALFAAALLLVITRKKSITSVTSRAVARWNSTTDPGPPSATSAPPFQDAAKNLLCAAGYSLWFDEATGTYACYRDPNAGITTSEDVQAAANQQDIFGGASFT